MVSETSKIRKEHRYRKLDKWLCEDRSMFFKRSEYDFETDDEDVEAQEFIENEEEISELTRLLEQSSLSKAHQHLKANKYQMTKAIDYKNPGVDYLPDKGRHQMINQALIKRMKEVE